MTSPANLPTMFGRFTAILQDHEHLGTSLNRLRAMCATLEELHSLPAELDLERIFGDLGSDLAEHFAAEEAEAYFGTVIEEAPGLADQIGILKGEHVVMLAEVDVLRQLALDSSEALKMPQLARALMARMERHERAESLLLGAYFSPDRERATLSGENRATSGTDLS